MGEPARLYFQLHSLVKRQNFWERRLWGELRALCSPKGAPWSWRGTCDRAGRGRSREWLQTASGEGWLGCWQEILHGEAAETVAVGAPRDGDAPSPPGGVQGQVKKGFEQTGLMGGGPGGLGWFRWGGWDGSGDF